MWNAIQDGSDLQGGNENEIKVVKAISNIFANGHASNDIYANYQKEAINNLRKHVSVWQSLYFLTNSMNKKDSVESQKILVNLAKQVDKEENTDKGKGIISLFISDCINLREKIKDVQKDDNIGTTIVPGTKTTYNFQVEKRFEFMYNFLNSP